MISPSPRGKYVKRTDVFAPKHVQSCLGQTCSYQQKFQLFWKNNSAGYSHQGEDKSGNVFWSSALQILWQCLFPVCEKAFLVNSQKNSCASIPVNLAGKHILSSLKTIFFENWGLYVILHPVKRRAILRESVKGVDSYPNIIIHIW